MTELAQTYYDQKNDDTFRRIDMRNLGEVDIPAGREFVVTRSNVSIDGRGTTLIPRDGAYQICGASSGSYEARKASGTVTADVTDSLTLTDVSGIAAGDIVLVWLGVSRLDPHECYAIEYHEVASVGGSTVTFARPFRSTPDVYASEAALESVSPYPERVGPWGLVAGEQFRGLGTDHGIQVFSSGQPVRNVRFRGLTIHWPRDARAYGSWAFYTQFTRNCQFRDCSVINPTGSCMHFFACEHSLSRNLRCTGYGRLQQYQGSIDVPAVAISQWSGDKCVYWGTTITAADTRLASFEGATFGTRVQRSTVASPIVNSATAHIAQDFGIYGIHRDCIFSDTVIDQQLNQSGVFPAYFPSDQKGLEFVRDEVPDYFHFDQLSSSGAYSFAGLKRIGSTRFRRLTRYNQPFTVGNAGLLDMPVGIILGGSVELASRNHVVDVVMPEHIFLDNPGETSLPLDMTHWGSMAPGETVDDYVTAHSQPDGLGIQVYTDGELVSGRLVLDYLPLRD